MCVGRWIVIGRSEGYEVREVREEKRQGRKKERSRERKKGKKRGIDNEGEGRRREE